jgi:hypothetical protein
MRLLCSPVRLLCALLLLLPACSSAGKPKPCRLMIVAGGFPRTASTAHLLLITTAAKQLGLDVANMGFHRYDRHAHLQGEEAKSWRDKHAKQKEAWTSDTVVVYKTHAFDAELLETCAQYLVFTSTMDQHWGMEDTLASICAAGWVECRLSGGGGAQLKGTAEFFEDAMEHHQRWLVHSSLNIQKSKMRSPFAFVSVCATIAAALELELPAAGCVPPQTWLDARMEEANPNIPHTGKMKREESRALVLALVEEGKRLNLTLLPQLRLRMDAQEGPRHQDPRVAR